MTDVMAGETCQGKLMGNLYQENYLFTLRAQGILHNMTYFLNQVQEGWISRGRQILQQVSQGL